MADDTAGYVAGVEAAAIAHLQEEPAVGRILLAMQIMSVELLAKAKVHVRDDGDCVTYFTKNKGRALTEATYNPRNRQLTWTGGRTTRQQDQCIRLHAELSARR